MQLASANPIGLRVLHIGGYWRGDNDLVRQMMLGLEETGAKVAEYNTDDHRDCLQPNGTYDRGTSGPVWLRWDMLRPVIEEVQPQLIVCNAGGLSFRPEDAARLRERHTLLGIALSDPEVFEPTTRHIAGNFDLFLTMAEGYPQRYENIGARCRLLTVATSGQQFYPAQTLDQYRCDVLIACRALPDRIDPVSMLARNFKVRVHGEGWDEHGIKAHPPIYGEEMLHALASASMSTVFLRTPSGHFLLKVGLFDFTAAGALVVTHHFPEVEAHFEYGKEIVGFSSTEELLGKVDHFLSHPEQAMAIRAAGRERTLRDHTWPAAWRRILGQLSDLSDHP